MCVTQILRLHTPPAEPNVYCTGDIATLWRN